MATGSSQSFATSYLLLKPDKVGFLDLPKILFSSNLDKIVERSNAEEESSPFHKINFVQSPEGSPTPYSEDSFRLRYLIFISTLIQMFLLQVAKPLAFFGHLFEFCLNLIYNNPNVFILFFNFLRGKKLVPDRKSPKFLSTIGILDKREKLDGSIEYGDTKYNVALSMMAAKESYENLAHIKTIVQDSWEMEFLESYGFFDEKGKTTTEAFIFVDKNKDHDTYVVAFRGTEPFNAYEWCTDFDISMYSFPDVGSIHGGFLKALGLQKNGQWPEESTRNDGNHRPIAYYAIRDILRKFLGQDDKARLIITGHSLGGALAIVFAATLIMQEESLLLNRLVEVYTFGQPRVGDKIFARYMRDKLRENNINYYRIVYNNDIVPRLPFDYKSAMFKHFGTCLCYNIRYGCEVVQQLPNKNYFSPWMAIPMMVSAMLELGRSFIIGWKYGAEYDEGWLERAFRVVGLAFPGLPDHFTQDYVNTTRLGAFLPYTSMRDSIEYED